MSTQKAPAPAKEFLGHLHAFRAIAILYIVAGHALDGFSWDGSTYLQQAIRVFFSNGSALFVFIAGYLFQFLASRFNVADYYRSKVRNVLLPYLLVSVPALAMVASASIVRLDIPQEFYGWPLWERVVWLLSTGKHLSPLWFVPMIALFYLAAPLLVAADRRPWCYLALPLLLWLTMHVGRGLPPQSFVHFLSFYVAGMFCCHYRHALDPWLRRGAVWGGLLAAALVFGLLELEGLLFGFQQYALNAWQKLCVALALLGALPAASRLVASAAVVELADLSFGIFFIHSYVITGAKMLHERLVGGLPAGGILLWATATLAVVVLCMLMLRSVKSVVGARSRWMVGC